MIGPRPTFFVSVLYRVGAVLPKVLVRGPVPVREPSVVGPQSESINWSKYNSHFLIFRDNLVIIIVMTQCRFKQQLGLTTPFLTDRRQLWRTSLPRISEVTLLR